MKNLADLIVIGAGWAGLYAAKYARAAGLSVRILEKRDALGGVWNYSDDPQTITVMRNTVSSSSRHVTEASDFPMSAEAGNLFRHDDALHYLRSYADAFGLTPSIETGVGAPFPIRSTPFGIRCWFRSWSAIVPSRRSHCCATCR